MKPETLLSILIPSVPQDMGRLSALLDIFAKQSDPRLEIMVFVDNQARTTGAKRNALVDFAAGRYLCHLDDDDTVAENYFQQVLPLLHFDTDLITYDAVVRFGSGGSIRMRAPPERCIWRTEFAKQFPFPEQSGGAEDLHFLKQALPAVQTWKKIDEVLFFHRYSASGSAFPSS